MFDSTRNTRAGAATPGIIASALADWPKLFAAAARRRNSREFSDDMCDTVPRRHRFRRIFKKRPDPITLFTAFAIERVRP
jgi:hypothetical protein